MKNNKLSIVKTVKKTTSAAIQSFGIAAVDQIVQLNPEWMPAWYLAKGTLNTLFQIRQERINELAKFIQKNPNKFSKTILKSKDFQDGFLIMFEEYTKQRNKKKRNYYQNIFLAFTKDTNKKEFELERMYDTLNKISTEHIKFMNNLIDKPQSFSSLDNQTITKKREKDQFNYLTYIGLLNLKVDRVVETESSGYGVELDENINISTESTLYEDEMYSLSKFGKQFIEFIINK